MLKKKRTKKYETLYIFRSYHFRPPIPLQDEVKPLNDLPSAVSRKSQLHVEETAQQHVIQSYL